MRKIILSVAYKPLSASYKEFYRRFPTVSSNNGSEVTARVLCMGDLILIFYLPFGFNFTFFSNFMVSNDLFPTVTIT